jgi:hypothetical protein
MLPSIVDFINLTQLASAIPDLHIEKGGKLSDCFLTKAQQQSHNCRVLNIIVADE